MSLWTHVRDTVTKPFREVEDLAGGLVNKALGRPSAADVRKQAQQVNDQIKAYKDQTELTRQQLNETRAQTNAQQRLVQEKQIRALRRNYRAQGVGMLGAGQPAAQDINSQLGS